MQLKQTNIQRLVLLTSLVQNDHGGWKPKFFAVKTEQKDWKHDEPHVKGAETKSLPGDNSAALPSVGTGQMLQESVRKSNMPSVKKPNKPVGHWTFHSGQSFTTTWFRRKFWNGLR